MTIASFGLATYPSSLYELPAFFFPLGRATSLKTS